MQETGVNADHKPRAGNKLRNLIKWYPVGNAGAWHSSRNELTPCPLNVRTPRHNQLKPRAKCLAKRDPVRIGPLLFGSRGCMQQQAVARSVISDPDAIESKIRIALGRVTKGQPTQHSVALDSVQIAVDTVTDIVKRRS